MQSPTVQPPPPPALPAPRQASPAPEPVPISTRQLGTSPRAVYEAVQERREVLGDQMSRLLNRRDEVSERLANANVGPTEKAALEQHIQELTTRIIDMEKQLHASDVEVAVAAGVPGAAVPDSRDGGYDGPPQEMFVVGAVFSGIALVLVAGAYARRIWKGTSKAVAQIPAAFEARFTRFEQSLDAVAIEVERVSEGQRFMTKLFADQSARAVGAGRAEPVENRAAIAEPVRRG